MYVGGDTDSMNWWKSATIENQQYLLPEEGSKLLGPENFQITSKKDICFHLNQIMQILEGKGHEVLVLDQTRPDVDLPVVKVLVPGLRHFWARFAPGRLYDIPVKLGWLQKSNREEDLNPIPMFL